MKKILAIMALAISGSAFAVDFASVDVDNVIGRQGASNSTAQYVRAGKGFGDYQFNLQSRTAKFAGGGMVNSLELTTSNNKVNIAGVTPFVGVGYDNGFNGAAGQGYNYGLVGATYGLPVGPGFLLTGIKTRVGSTEDGDRTKQTVGFATYSIPVAKQVALNFNASRSGETIKEKAYGVGVTVAF